MLKIDMEHCKNRVKRILKTTGGHESNNISEYESRINELLRAGYHPDHVVKQVLWGTIGFPQ